MVVMEIYSLGPLQLGGFGAIVDHLAVYELCERMGVPRKDQLSVLERVVYYHGMVSEKEEGTPNEHPQNSSYLAFLRGLTAEIGISIASQGNRLKSPLNLPGAE